MNSSSPNSAKISRIYRGGSWCLDFDTLDTKLNTLAMYGILYAVNAVNGSGAKRVIL